jgi:hypothetical protein
MTNDMHSSEASRLLSWPSQASASAELRRPRPSWVGRAERPAVPRLVRPASVERDSDLSIRRYALYEGEERR